MVGLLGADVESYFLEGCQMRLEVGKKYKTRLGHRAFIFSTSGIPQEALGYIELHDGSHEPSRWFMDGAFHCDKKESCNDIISEWTEPKPPQYIPYTWEDREQLRGRWYREKATQPEVMIKRLSINLKGELLVNGFNASWLLANCEWLDGTPCGKVVE